MIKISPKRVLYAEYCVSNRLNEIHHSLSLGRCKYVQKFNTRCSSLQKRFAGTSRFVAI